MRCSNCGSENREGRKFCAKCGARLAPQCTQCHASNEPGEDFCGECGTALIKQTRTDSAKLAKPNPPPPEIQVTAHGGRDAHDGERKTVTALFADLKGSTELMRDIDPEEARAILDPVLQLMMTAVHRYDGYVAQSTGDGIFAMFGAPVAHEDHPQRALHAALAIQQELRRYGEKMKAAGQPALEARIGINTGEVVLRMVNTGAHTEYSPVGHAANLAARLQTVAPAGGIIVSDDTRKLVQDYFELRHLGPATLRGIAEPVDVYEVTSAGPSRGHFDVAARRGLTRFVGRERELEHIRQALEQAMAGQGQVVAVIAEAGTGKSRLFYEFKTTIPSTCKVLEAYSLSHGRTSAWLPVLELLRGYFSMADADDPTTRRDKVRAAVMTLDSALEDTLPYLFSLLAIHEGPDPHVQMDPRIKRQRTLEAVKRIFVRDSLNQPLVVIFEDLHWIDEQTQALLDSLVDGLARASLLLMVNYRPEYRHEWTNRSYYSQLRLDPLGSAEGAAMLGMLLGESFELNPLKQLIAERTGGNPFFIEEIVQALFGEGALVRNGVVKVAHPLPRLRLPPTVQGILAARIDRLSTAQKDLLQTLAVIGGVSSLDLLRQVASTDQTQLEQRLAELQVGEFVYQQPAAGDVEYVFKHALTQEVAYSSVLSERRKALHDRVARGLETLFANSIDEHLTELAYHYSRGSRDDEAVKYLVRAGEQALQLSAFSQAATYLEGGLTRLEQLPISSERDVAEIAIRRNLADVTMVTRGYAAPEYERHLVRRHELADRLRDNTQIFYSLVGISIFSAFRLELGKAQEIGTKLLEIAA